METRLYDPSTTWRPGLKTTLAPEDEYCILLLFLQAIILIMGIALINAKAKSVIVLAIILFSSSIEGDS